MVYDIIYFFLALLAAISYLRNKNKSFLILLFTILSNCWGILPTGHIKTYDWILVVTCLSLIIGFCKSKVFFRIKNDPLGKMVLFLLNYVFISAVLTAIRGVESLGSALLVLRFDLFYLLYFVFRRIPLKDLKLSVRPLIILSLINGLVYYLQYCGIFIMANSDVVSDLDENRYTNIPILTLAIFFFFFLLKRKGKEKILALMFFGGIIIGSQNRAMILAVAFAVVVYLILNYKKGFIEKKTIITLVVVGILSSGVLAYRFSQEGSTGKGLKSEIELAYSIYQTGSYKLYDNQMMNSEGTFAFRLAMIFERVDYLVKRPFSLLIGAGCYNEKSLSTKRLPFILGSRGEDGIQKVDTTDVALLSHFFRYGLLYVTIYWIFILKTIKISYKNNSIESQVYFLLLLCYIAWAICGDVFHTAQNFMLPLCLMTYLQKRQILRNKNCGEYHIKNI